MHPTTIGYGIVAQEIINVMSGAGVVFYRGDGVTPRTDPIQVDFDRLIARDTLIADPPKSVAGDFKIIGWLDERYELFKRLFGMPIA